VTSTRSRPTRRRQPWRPRAERKSTSASGSHARAGMRGAWRASSAEYDAESSPDDEENFDDASKELRRGPQGQEHRHGRGEQSGCALILEKTMVRACVAEKSQCIV